MTRDDWWTTTGPVELFDRPGGWHFVRVPDDATDALASLADRGLIAVDLELGESAWKASLLPYGDGSHFIALNAKVRGRNDLDVGDVVTVRFRPR